MEITVTQTAGVAIVAVTGDLDAAAAPRMKRALQDLLEAGTHRVVVDLGGVGYIDSAGLGEIVRAMKRARESAGDVRLCALDGNVLQIFEMTRLQQRMAVFATRREAVASWA